MLSVSKKVEISSNDSKYIELKKAEAFAYWQTYMEKAK